MEEIKMNRWCLIAKNGVYGTPFIYRAFETKEEALNALEIVAESRRAGQKKFKDPNACIVEKIGEDAYLWAVKFAEDNPYDYSWYWVGDRTDFEEETLPRHIEEDILKNTGKIINWRYDD